MRPRRRITYFLLALAAMGLGLVAQGFFSRDLKSDALVVYVIAAALFLYAAIRAERAEDLQSDRPSPGSSIRFPLLVAGILGVALAQNLYFGYELGAREHPNGAWLMWGISLIIFMAAVALVDYGRARWPSREGGGGHRWWPRELPPRLEIAGLAGAVVLASFLRVYQINVFPEGCWFDEAQNGLETLKILTDDSYRPVYIGGATQLPAMFFYGLAMFFKAFGSGLLSIRALTTLAGILTIPILYLFVREMWGWRVALLSAFFLAVSRWHINFSRFGMNGILTPFLGALLFFLLLRALRTRRFPYYAGAGLVLGAGLHSYIGFWLMPLVLIVFLVRKLFPHPLIFLRQHYQGLLILFVGALMVFSPLGWYAKENPDDFMARTQTTNIVRNREPGEVVSALSTSLSKHLLMFNYRGDPNGRHNLPGRPMLDTATSILFVLGLVYCLYRWKRPGSFLLLIWFIAMLSAGVLSLEFEAPQAYRTIGILPVIAIFPSLALQGVCKTFEEGFGKKAWPLLAGLVGLILVQAGWANYDVYFHQQTQDRSVWAAFSGPETRIARHLQAYEGDYDLYLAPVYVGHPTLRFLAPDAPRQVPFDPILHVPAKGHAFGEFRAHLGGQAEAVQISREEAPSQDVVYVLDTHYSYLFPLLRAAYPGGIFEEEMDDWRHVVFLSGWVPAREVSGVRGLDGRYYRGEEWQGEPFLKRSGEAIDFNWSDVDAPSTAPFSVQWEGMLFVPRYDRYSLGLDSAGPSQLLLDGMLLVDNPGGSHADAAAVLYRGLHHIEVKYAQSEPQGNIQLYWMSPGSELQVIPQAALYSPAIPSFGLVGSYYPNDTWTGEQAYRQLDPGMSFLFHFFPLPRPYSVEWTGQIYIPMDGIYRFATESIDYSWVYLDEKMVVDNGREVNRYVEGSVQLAQGWHPIRVRYLNRIDHAHLYLYWIPPGGAREIVPSTNLSPAEGALEAPVEAPLEPEPVAVSPVSLTLEMKSVWTEEEGYEVLEEPRGIAVDSGGDVYVADRGAGLVLKYDAEGGLLASWDGTMEGGARFAEPFDVAVGLEDRVYVLDSAARHLRAFHSDGSPLSGFKGLDGLYNPRGIGVAPSGDIYVADTGGERVIHFSSSGELLGQYGGGGPMAGLISQPTDVAVDSRGFLYIADPNLGRVVQLDDRGLQRQGWAIAPANTMDSPHLAVGNRGEIYLTDPEAGHLLVFDGTGNLVESFGSTGRGPGQFRKPVGVGIGPDGDVYVADTGNRRVQVLASAD
jgi:DNA-binding beta-propeller fold protein YncE